MQTEIYRKELEIMIATVPVAKRIAVLWNPDTPSHIPELKTLEESARTLQVQLQPVVARNKADFEGAFSAMAGAHAQALLVLAFGPYNVLRPGGWLGVCDGDFATATLSTGDLDPLQVCVNAFVEGFVNDRWMVRRMSRLAADAGFDVSPLRSYGLVETEKPALTATWVDRGADVLASRGQISQELAAALKAEAKRRALTNAFFGYMAYASMIGRKRR